MSKKSGFTIFETLIVLAVTSVLLIAALASISGRQGRTQFAQGVRETETMIRDVLNDTGNGILPVIDSFVCETVSSDPDHPHLSYSSSAPDLARNEDCVLAGSIMLIDGDTDSSQLTTYAVAGRRLTSTGTMVKSFDEIHPVIIYPEEAESDDTRINSASTRKLPWGITMVGSDTATPSAIILGVFYKDFRGESLASGNITSGNSSLGVVRIGSTSSGTSTTLGPAVHIVIEKLTSASFNPNSKYSICLKSGTSDQFGIIEVGQGINGLAVSSKIVEDLAAEVAGGVACE